MISKYSNSYEKVVLRVGLFKGLFIVYTLHKNMKRKFERSVCFIYFVRIFDEDEVVYGRNFDTEKLHKALLGGDPPTYFQRVKSQDPSTRH